MVCPEYNNYMKCVVWATYFDDQTQFAFEHFF